MNDYDNLIFELPSPQVHDTPLCPTCGRLMIHRCNWCDYQARLKASNRRYARRRLFRRLGTIVTYMGYGALIFWLANLAAYLLFSANAGCHYNPHPGYFSGPVRILHTYPTD